MIQPLAALNLCPRSPLDAHSESICSSAKVPDSYYKNSLTSVGATSGTDPEVAASLSSGGFSNVFSTPSFQQSAVSAYLSWLGDTYSGLYNAEGRGYPDVSSQGVDLAIVLNGEIEPVQGTSCSSPTFASIIALLNDELASAGKSRLGWLNPWLYSNPDALNNITSGSNPGCGTDGFYATMGWSPVRTIESLAIGLRH